MDRPDDLRTFPNGVGAVARFGLGTVHRSTLQPGWIWSRDVGAANGQQWCAAPHLGYVVSGRMAGRTPDGLEFEYGAGEAFALEPGHDVWVVGDEPYVSVDTTPAPPVAPATAAASAAPAASAASAAPGARAFPGAAADVLATIGNTPLVQLRRLPTPGSARVFVKVEGTNPTGSMKDRMAVAAIDAAERDGRLRPGASVVEYTGGSTGTAIALVCAARGYPLHIVTSDAFSQEKRDHQAALGARITLVESDGGRITEQLIKTMIEVARRIERETGAWWVDQLNNVDAATGYEPLGEEIWAQTGGRIDAFVHSVGTAHSIQGVNAALRRHKADLVTVAVEPAESPILSGGQTGAHEIEGIGIGFTPPLWDPADASEYMSVSTHDAEVMARRLAREEALFTGASSGANVVAALRVAERLGRELGPVHGPDAVVVTILVDSGLKYLTTEVYRDAERGSVVERLPLMSRAELGLEAPERQGVAGDIAGH
jgi:cysteine synthase A